MRQAHTVEQVRTAEAEAMATLPAGALMQRAAAGLTAAIVDLLGGVYGAKVLLLVGSGDNGGDALVAGAMLLRRGAQVSAVLLGDNAHTVAFLEAGGRVVSARDAAGSSPDLVVDGIVGIGGRAGLKREAAALVGALVGVPVVAVDVPSGVGVDTGELDGAHVRADVTVTFGTFKVAHLADPAAEAAGVVHLVDLGLDLPPADVEALQAEDVAALLPRPGPFGHKYTRGVVGLRTGSAAYTGAALLGVAGANCGLAGMVRYDGAAADLVRAAHPEVVIGPGRVQAWVVGSGSGEVASEALAACLTDRVPVIVDADALASFVAGSGEAILTPHAGELAAMLGVAREEVEASPLAFAREAAGRWDAVVLLKGRHSVTAHPAGRARITTTGVPWLGTAGSGDVLAGLVGALAAAGLTPFDAASVGSWLHGCAGTVAGGSGGPIVAGDVAAALPALLRREGFVAG